MKYCVYKHTSPSGKCYIGLTCQGMERRARKVRCVETGVVFDTIKEAGLFTGGSTKNIIAVCMGRLKLLVATIGNTSTRRWPDE